MDYNKKSNKVRELGDAEKFDEAKVNIDDVFRCFIRIVGSSLCFLMMYVNATQSQVLRDSFQFIPDRLTPHECYDMAIDEQGLWWVGTERWGLMQFDGTSYTFVRIIDEEGQEIHAYTIFRVLKSKALDKTLLLGTRGNGIIEYNYETGVGISNQRNPLDSNTILGNHVLDFIEEENGDYWICTDCFALSYFDRKKGVFKNYQPPLPYADITSHAKAGYLGMMVRCPINKDHLWIASRFGLYRFDKITRTFTFFPFEKEYKYHGSTRTLALFADEQEKILWVGKFNDGLWRYDPSTGQPISEGVKWGKREDYNFNFVGSIYPFDENTILVGSWQNFIAEFNRQSGEFRDVFDKKDGLPHNWFEVKKFHPDERDNLWLVSRHGVYRFAPKVMLSEYLPWENWLGHPFRRRINGQWPPSKNNWVASDCFSASGKQLFIGTNKGDGLLVYEIPQDSFWLVRYKSGPTYEEKDVRMGALCEDHNGKLWIGTEKGLAYLDKATKTIHSFVGGNNLVSGSFISALAHQTPYLYIGVSNSGIFRLDVERQELVPFLPNGKIKLLPDFYISKLYFDQKEQLWIGTGSGLFIYDTREMRFLPLTEEVGGGKWLSHLRVNDIEGLPNGDIYLTTSGNGLVSYHPAKKLWRNHKSEKYNENFLGKIALSANQKLIIGGRNWISEFDPSLPYEEYPKMRSIKTHVGSGRNIITFPDGRIWGGSNRGVTSYWFPPLDGQFANMPVYLKNITVSGKQKYSASQLSTKKKIELSYQENTLAIEPGALNFAVRASNNFVQKLEGVDKDWKSVDPENLITYANLAPGHYRYRYKASDQTGRWIEKPAYLDIIIHPPWWRSNIAYTVYALLFLAALAFARRQIIQREQLKGQLELEQMEKKKAQEIDQLRARFFANISHEFRTPLTLIKAPLEDLLTSRADDAEWLTFYGMHENAKRLLHLVNQLLELSRLEAGVLQLKNEPGDINAFMRQLTGNFQSLAEQKKLDFRVNVPQEELWLEYDSDKLEKIILNLLSNAVKFSPENGWVIFKAGFSDRLVVEIGNNGDPIPAGEQPRIFERFYQAGDTRHQGAGIGLALAREFVELYNGTISVKSDAENGTWFRVELPLEVAENEVVAQIDFIEMPTVERDNTIVAPIHIAEKSGSSIGVPLSNKKGKERPLLLLVEDHEEVRTYIRSKLAPHFRITEAADGQQGWEAATKHLPDLIISDLMMPVMDGVTFCKKTKTDVRTDHIPFIMLTAKADIESRLQGLITGADEYLAKPFNSQELLVRSQNLIAQRKRLQERFQQGSGFLKNSIEVNSVEERFLQKAIAVVEENMDNVDFKIDGFAAQLHLSRVHLHRKLKAITGMNATEFVRNLRLERAAQLLDQDADSVAQVAYRVGFNNLSYFAKCFREKYGRAPSRFKKY